MATISRQIATCVLLLVAPAIAHAGLAPSRTASSYTVCVQPLGEHDRSLLAPIERGLAQAYGFKVRGLAAQPLPSAAWYAPRQRYRALRLLEYLRAQPQRGCDAVLGFTARDISTTKGAHADWGVLGLALTGGRVAVVSSFRMRRDADRPLVAKRAVKVSIHEVGHGLGLPHRADGPECIMNDAGGSVRTVDRAQGSLCASERAAAEAALGLRLPARARLDWNAILR
jgi:archaemetzincin